MKGWTWVLAFIAAACVIAAVAFGAYRAGQHHGDGHNEVVRITTPSDSGGSGVQVVHVDGGRHWGHGGFFPGFFFLPLLFLLLFFVVFRWGPWRRGPWGAGFEEWHRRQHEPPSGQGSA